MSVSSKRGEGVNPTLDVSPAAPMTIELKNYRKINGENEIIQFIHKIYSSSFGENINEMVNKLMIDYFVRLGRGDDYFKLGNNSKLLELLALDETNKDNRVLINGSKKSITVILTGEELHDFIDKRKYSNSQMEHFNSFDMNSYSKKYNDLDKNVRDHINSENNCLLFYCKGKITLYLYSSEPTRIYYKCFAMDYTRSDKKLIKRLIPGNYKKYSILDRQLALVNGLLNAVDKGDGDSFKSNLYLLTTNMRHNGERFKVKIYKRDKKIMKRLEKYYNMCATDRGRL